MSYDIHNGARQEHVIFALHFFNLGASNLKIITHINRRDEH
jgi:hypothetical protein